MKSEIIDLSSAQEFFQKREVIIFGSEHYYSKQAVSLKRIKHINIRNIWIKELIYLKKYEFYFA